MLASQEGSAESVRLLLEAGTDKDFAASDDGTTAMILASGGGHAETVRSSF